jgi:hypothetical protein
MGGKMESRWESLKRITTLLTVFTVVLWTILSPPITLPQENPPIWEVYFSPHGGCTDAVIGELNKTKSTILV